MHAIQRKLANAQIGSLNKILKVDKDKNDATKEAYSTRENPIYYTQGQNMP